MWDTRVLPEFWKEYGRFGGIGGEDGRAAQPRGRAPELQSIGGHSLATTDSISDQIRNAWNWKSINDESTRSLKKVPHVPSIECRALPPTPQVMKPCLILVLGHRYETCTLVFYRGVFKKKCPKCTHGPLFYRENGVKKKHVHLNSIEVVLRGWPVPPGFITIKWGKHQCTPGIHRGILKLSAKAPEMVKPAPQQRKFVFQLPSPSSSAMNFRGAVYLYNFGIFFEMDGWSPRELPV